MLYIAADDALANFAVESLKQLNKSARAPAGTKDEATVVVAAQFALPDYGAKPKPTNLNNPGGAQNRRRYVFEKDSRAKLVDNEVKPPTGAAAQTSDKADISDTANSSEKEALKDFLTWAYQEYEADHYALILWGHGPELLLQPPATDSGGDRANLYLTPEELRDALTDCKPRNGRHLEIIGFDACCMSMLEMAYELKGLADFMVASQEDVPDLSFPYDNLIELFRKCGKKAIPSLLSEGVKAYISTYEDCICNNNTGMQGATLSVLDLRTCDALTNAVGKLACALLKAREDESLPGALIQARSDSQDYAGGLYVDLFDFCTKLSEQIKKLNQQIKWTAGIEGLGAIEGACEIVLNELTKRPPKDSDETKGDGTLDSVILANSGDTQGRPASDSVLANSNDPKGNGSSTRKNSHGISIYLPYLTDGQYATVSKPLVKGGSGTRGAKGYTEVLNGAAVEYLMCARRDLILVTESYYEDLQLAKTGWYDFIAEVWTKALIKKVPADLDYHYSAQQSWVNVCRKTIFDRDPEKSPEPLVEMCSAK